MLIESNRPKGSGDGCRISSLRSLLRRQRAERGQLDRRVCGLFWENASLN
jgi:hypothetical protein